MVAVVSFNKRVPPGAASTGTLKALMERARAAADARAAATEPVQIADPMQGVAHVAQSITGALAERRALNEEQRGREELARLKAQVGVGSEASGELLAQIGALDPEVEKMYREEALQARRDEAARQEAKATLEDTQAHALALQQGQQTFQAGENRAQRDLTVSEGEASRALTASEGAAGRDATRAEGAATRAAAKDNLKTQLDATAAEGAATRAATKENLGTQIGATATENAANRALTASEGAAGRTSAEQIATNRIQADKDAAAVLAGAPKSDTGIAVREYNAGLYGTKGSPEAVKRLNDEINFATTHKGPDTILMQGGGTIRQKLYETMGTKIIPAYMAEASQAGNLTRQMDVLDQLDPTVSGPILGGLAEAYPFLKNFDSQASAFEAIVKLAAPRQREEGSGSTSDIEYQGMLESLPQLATNPEARKLVAEVVRAQAAISLARGEAIRKFQNDANNPNADTELFNALADIDSRHVVSPRLQAMIDEIKGKKGAAAQTAPGAGSLRPGIVSISPAD